MSLCIHRCQRKGLRHLIFGSSMAIIMVIGSTLAQAKPQPKASGINKAFRKGVDAYEAKSYDDAVDILGQVLQKQADYVPAKIYLARTLYQLKRFSEAYKLFSQIEDISILEPDPSYEYGQSAFRNNDYPKALQAFRNVPNGHPLYDLAGFYGGISAFKQGDYQLAIDLLEQAVVLPSKLVKSQKLYLKEAERLLIQKQKQDLQASIPPSPQRAQRGEQAAEAPKIYRYLITDQRLQFLPTYSIQTQRIGEQNEQFAIQEGQVVFAYGWQHESSQPKAPHWVGQTLVSAQAFQGKSRDIPFHPDALAEQKEFAIKRNQPRSLFHFEPSVDAEWAIATGTSLGLGLSARGLLPGDEGSKGVGAPSIRLFLAQKNASLETVLRSDFYAFFFGDEFLFSNARQIGRIDFRGQNKLAFSLQGELSQYAYNVDRVDGPDWQGRIATEIKYAHPKGFFLEVVGYFEITEAQRYHDLPEAAILQFDANGLGAQLKAGFELVKNLNLELSAAVLDRKTSGLKPKSEETEAAMKQAYPSSISETKVGLNLNLQW